MKEGKGKEWNIQSLKYKVYLIFVVVVMAVTVFLSAVILRKSDTIIKSKVSAMIFANTIQLKLNVSSYLEKLEHPGTMMFSDKSYYTYDATDNSLSEYEKLNIEEAIENRIVDLGMIENFGDFGIIYSNNDSVGWVSNGTRELYKSDIYNTLAGYITDEHTQDGWFTEYEGNYERLNYVKRMNDNAILLTTFYTRELEDVFVVPEELGDLTVSLLDKENQVIYSTNEGWIGEQIPSEIVDVIGDNTHFAGYSNQYLATVSECENNWRVVCSVPTKLVLKESAELKVYTFIICSVISIFFFIIGLFLVKWITKPVTGMVNSLEYRAQYDLLSGLLNKNTFTNNAKQMITEIKNKQYALLLIDVDNFKSINDTLGHVHGDEVIDKMGKLLQECFMENAICGRVGGDEFAVFINFCNLPKADIQKKASLDAEILLRAFRKRFMVEYADLSVSLSVGIAIAEGKEISFKELYKRADDALYTSKGNGKNTFTVANQEVTK